jgi:hypothetical protein
MFSERLFEDILVKYPELIEGKLKFIGRQVNHYGKRIDILFEDRFNEKLIIELKKDNLDRNALSQVMEYEGYILSEKDPSARVMLIANRIPLNFKKAMEHHGIEYKEITQKQILEFLEKNDHQLFIQITSPMQQQGQQQPMAISKILLNRSKITRLNRFADQSRSSDNSTDRITSRRSKIIELINQGLSDFEILEVLDKIFPSGHFITSNKQAIYGTRRDIRLKLK